MKYLLQLLWILLLSFLGECLHLLIPLPVPASIYGMVLLFAALSLRIIRPEQIRETGHFLVEIMGVLFICPAVGLLDCLDVVKGNAAAICVITLVSLVLVFLVSGWVTQLLMKKRGAENG